MSRLLAAEETMYTELDRVLINEDYAPYGHPEKQPEETSDAGLTRADSSASADTVSDTKVTGQLECPSLGALLFVEPAVDSQTQGVCTDI